MKTTLQNAKGAICALLEQVSQMRGMFQDSDDAISNAVQAGEDAADEITAALARPVKVYVTTFEHKHGRDVAAWATAERAELERQRIAAEWWEQELSGADMPDDPSEAADEYFGTVDEYFNIDECEVQS
jgi:hypothetical protein